jgi:hypothetical protein
MQRAVYKHHMCVSVSRSSYLGLIVVLMFELWQRIVMYVMMDRRMSIAAVGGSYDANKSMICFKRENESKIRGSIKASFSLSMKMFCVNCERFIEKIWLYMWIQSRDHKKFKRSC